MTPGMPRPEKPRIRVALAQISPVLGDVSANIERARSLAIEAADHGAELIVFPELALTGYFIKDLAVEVARRLDSPDLAPLAAASHRLSIVAGLIEQGADHALYNTAALWQDGVARVVHRKVYLPTYGLFEEGRYLARGRRLAAIDSPLGRLGVLICEDIWHPSTVYVTTLDGAELLIVMAASPTREAGVGPFSRSAAMWLDLLRAHAILHGIHIVFVNRVGFEDGISFWGGSRIMAPSGASITEAPFFDEALVHGVLDHRDVLRERMRSHHVWDEDPEFTLRALRSALRRRRRRDAFPEGGAGRPEGEA